jgi:hypothetical protein
VLAVPRDWERWRDELAAIRPALYRLPVVWHAVQPDAAAPPDLDAPNRGCLRETPPCAAYAGVRDQLRALASRGRPVQVVITGTPEWAQQPQAGCREDAGAEPPRPDALPAYRRLVAAILDAGERAGADLRYWSPFNEPNHPLFLAGQRSDCDADAPSRAPAEYARIARALRAELEAQPGEQRLTLGELAFSRSPRPRSTTIREFYAGLPRELVCSTTIAAQHAYAGGEAGVRELTRALRRHDCPRPHTIWITETGVGPVNGRAVRDQRAGCRRLAAALRGYYRDQHVTLALQYTFREDDLFPTGLVSTDLTTPRPALALWQAWGGDRAPGDRPPRGVCG